MRKRFANFVPDDQRLPKRMEQLPRGVYLAMQRAMENVWFGISAPYEQACEQARIDDGEEVRADEIYEQVVVFCNLLLRTLPKDVLERDLFLQARLGGIWLSMCERLLVGVKEVGDLKRREIELEDQLQPLRRDVLALEKRLKLYKTRAKNLAAAEQDLQQLIDADHLNELDELPL